MSYIEKYLMNGESVVYRTTLHWIVFLWPAVWIVLGIMLFASGTSDVGAFGSILILIGIITGISSFINYKTSEFGITNKRIIAKSGCIRRHSLELLLKKVEGVEVDQSILGRIIGSGSIIIHGTGGTKNPFHKIHSPLEFREKANGQIEASQDLK